MPMKNGISNVDHDFDEMNSRLTALQDLILKIKLDFDLMTQTQISSGLNSQLIVSTEEMINQFLDNRPLGCEVINQCSTFLQKGIMKVLRVFSEKGYNEANELINRYIDYTDSYLEKGICQDGICLDSAKSILITIKDYVVISRQKSISGFKDLMINEIEFESFEGNEKRESKLMSVLGNETRIRILKELSKGSNYYTQLERILGLKGGHFNFHLKELKDAEFVETRERDKLYHITPKGLKALKMLFEISRI